jgi:hypothetical protein
MNRGWRLYIAIVVLLGAAVFAILLWGLMPS